MTRLAIIVACLAYSMIGCTSTLVQCKVDALKVLPDDPGQATVRDAIDVVRRVKACHDAEPAEVEE